MKKYIIVLLFVVSFSVIKAHETWVHWYITARAFELLELYYEKHGGDKNLLNEIRGKIYFYNGYATPRYNEIVDRGKPFMSLYPLMTGVMAEDYEDVVYEYDRFDDSGIMQVLSHFWRPDSGVGSYNTFSLYPYGSYPNSLMKANDILFGGNFFIRHQIVYKGRDIYGILVDKESIIELYKGKYKIKGYYYDSSGIYRFMSDSTFLFEDVGLNSKDVAYKLLGHVLHLLEDMSVPAHVRIIEHPCIMGLQDDYELWVGGISCGGSEPEEFKAKEILSNNNVNIDIGRMLWDFNYNNDIEFIYNVFYTIAEISDFFPAGSSNMFFNTIKQGNDYLPAGANEYINDVYKKNELYNIKKFDNSILTQIAINTLPYVVAATASVIYWFGIRTNQVNCQYTFYESLLHNDIEEEEIKILYNDGNIDIWASKKGNIIIYDVMGRLLISEEVRDRFLKIPINCRLPLMYQYVCNNKVKTGVIR